MVSLINSVPLVLCLTVAGLWTSFANKWNWHSYMTFNRRVDVLAFMSLHPVALRACVEECVFRPLCTSVNYKRRAHHCDLNNDMENETFPLITCSEFVTVRVRNGTNLLFQHPRCEDSSNVWSCEVFECSFQTNASNGGANGVNDTSPAACDLDQCPSNQGMCQYDCGIPQFNVTLSKALPVNAEIYALSGKHVFDISNMSSINNLTGYLNSSLIEFKCLHGGDMEGDKFVTCRNGSWSDFPTCATSTLSPIAIPCTTNTDCTTVSSECRDGICKCIRHYNYHYGIGKCTQICQVYADTFQEEQNMRLASRNLVILPLQTVNECANACLEESSFVCRSFEFSNVLGLCQLQQVISTVGDFGTSKKLDYYQRDCNE